MGSGVRVLAALPQEQDGRGSLHTPHLCTVKVLGSLAASLTG